MIFHKFHQFCGICNHSIVAFAVPVNGLNLRMGHISRYEHQPLGAIILGYDLMDLRHKRAGGIHTGKPQGSDLIIDALSYAMGTDHHLAPGRLLRGGDGLHPLFRQFLHQLGIVDNRPQSADGLPGLNQVIDHLDRPVHSKTEPGSLGYLNTHSCSPRCSQAPCRTAAGWHCAAPGPKRTR